MYNLEMQTTSEPGLPKRTRFYQDIIDLNLLEKGEPYEKLKKSYIIFICTFDPYNAGLPVYTFEYRCKEDLSLAMCDDTQRIFVNGKAKNVSGLLGEFIHFLDGKISGNLSSELAAAVTAVKQNKDFRREFMILYMRDRENIQKGIRQGREEGIKEGIKEGIREIVKHMLCSGRSAEEIAALCGLNPEQVTEVEKNL